jgi:hypothetical protein
MNLSNEQLIQSGKGWRALRRYRFNRTNTPTTYIVRAQVRGMAGYPYSPGNSAQLALRVLP